MKLLALLFAAGCATEGGDDVKCEIAPMNDVGVSTLAGCALPGFADGSREEAQFFNPVDVAFGPDGKVYVADFDNDAIRIVDMAGNVSTLVKGGKGGVIPGFCNPFGMQFVGSTLYVSTDDDSKCMHSPDSGAVWRVDGPNRVTLVKEGIARPRGLYALKDGRLAVTDYQKHVVSTLNPSSGEYVVLAGKWGAAGYADGVGEAARFSIPYDVIQSPNNALMVTDHANSRLRVITLDGTVTTYGGSAGFADGPAAQAKFKFPQGIAMDSKAVAYISDTGNFRIRRIDLNEGIVSTIAGSGKGGSVDSEDPMAAEFYGLEGIAVSPDGKTIVVTDGSRGDAALPHNSVRIIKL